MSKVVGLRATHTHARVYARWLCCPLAFSRHYRYKYATKGAVTHPISKLNYLSFSSHSLKAFVVKDSVEFYTCIL